MFYEWFGCTRRWREGGGRRGDASGFTLGWIGNVAVSAVQWQSLSGEDI